MIAEMRTAIFAFAASAFLLPEHAGAVERPDTLRYVMEEIVVFGRRSVTPPATVSEIDAGGIARRLGSTHGPPSAGAPRASSTCSVVSTPCSISN